MAFDGVRKDVLECCEAVVASYVKNRAAPDTSWFLIGSQASGDAVELSDIDLLGVATAPMLFDGWEATERARWGGRLELHVVFLGDLNEVPHARFIPMLRTAVLTAGQDVREELPEVDLDAYRTTAIWRFRNGIDQFFPDEIATLPNRVDGLPAYVVDAPAWTEVGVWTHDLVVFIGQGATAVTARHGLIAGSRAQAIDNLAGVDDAGEWADWARDSVEFLRTEHGYRVQDDPGYLDHLREISDRVPAFARFCLRATPTIVA
jgi:hypothetical protein